MLAYVLQLSFTEADVRTDVHGPRIVTNLHRYLLSSRYGLDDELAACYTTESC